MTTPFQQLLASPDCYFHSIEGEDGIFVPMDRAAYARSIFLDRRISPAATGGWRVPLAELAAAAPPALPTGWIFHVAHCGSTLLARALQELHGGLVLREPLALRQLALAPDPALLYPMLALLSRRYAGAGPTVIKANVPVNFLLPRITDADPSAPAVMLWSNLRDYLLAVLRSPTHREWVRNVSGLLASHLGETSASSDAELVAALWIAQHRRFAEALARMPNARSLEAELFFRAPAQALVQTSALFGSPATAATAEAVAGGPLFSTYSKNPSHAFDNAMRTERRRALETELGPEIAEAERWIEARAPDAPQVVARIAAASL